MPLRLCVFSTGYNQQPLWELVVSSEGYNYSLRFCDISRLAILYDAAPGFPSVTWSGGELIRSTVHF